MEYFFDTSALVKLYHKEKGSDIVLSLFHQSESIIISELSKVEFLSTIHKKYRTQEIDLNTVELLIERFNSDCLEHFAVIPIVSSIIDSSVKLIESYGKKFHLFSLDAIQLACFILFDENNLTFVCSDKRVINLVQQMKYSFLEV